MSKSDFIFLDPISLQPKRCKLIQVKAALCFIGMNENQDHFLIDSLGLS